MNAHTRLGWTAAHFNCLNHLLEGIASPGRALQPQPAAFLISSASQPATAKRRLGFGQRPASRWGSGACVGGFSRAAARVPSPPAGAIGVRAASERGSAARRRQVGERGWDVGLPRTWWGEEDRHGARVRDVGTVGEGEGAAPDRVCELRDRISLFSAPSPGYRLHPAAEDRGSPAGTHSSPCLSFRFPSSLW